MTIIESISHNSLTLQQFQTFVISSLLLNTKEDTCKNIENPDIELHSFSL